jgi:hypothetical protein
MKSPNRQISFATSHLSHLAPGRFPRRPIRQLAEGRNGTLFKARNSNYQSLLHTYYTPFQGENQA